MPTAADALTHSAALGRQVATLLDPEIPADGVTTGTIRPELRSIASISSVEGHQLDPARDFSIKF